MLTQQNNVWVAIKPIQCLSNAWEKDWLASHKNAVAKYPIEKDLDILKSFLKRKGINVSELRINPYTDKKPRICKSCDCERGETLFLLISTADVGKAKPYGFTPAVEAKPLK